jgi:DNA polymerase III subunit chi
MAEVLFYHLTRTPLEATLPELLVKSRARGWNVVVRCGSKERLEWLDQRLWLGEETSFLAHGLAGGDKDMDQPILLTNTSETPNNAEILFVVDMAEVSANEATDFTRVCVVFDGNDQTALSHAREQWKSLTDAGLPAKYWSQEGGNWAEKASKNT